MKTHVLLLLVFSVASITLSQDDDFGLRNGYFWQSYHKDATTMLEKTNISNMSDGIRILEYNLKVNYVLGVFDLVSILPTDRYFVLKDIDGKKIYYEAEHPFPYTYRVSPDQMVKALDKFYQDFRNMNIRILDAMHVAKMEITGKDPEAIEWQIRYYRADESTRSQMIIEKTKKKE